MRHLATVLTLGTLVACSPLVRAADLDSSRRPLQVNIMQEPAEFEDPYYCAYVTSGDAKFTFVIPQGFRLKGDTSAGGVFLGNQNGDSTLSFAILTSSAEPGPLNPELSRASVLRQHPGAKITQEYSAGALGKVGLGFDIQWQVSDNIFECERVAMVPSAFGTFIFTSTSGRKAFSHAQENLSVLMSTFRASTDGKFRPVHISPVN